MQTEIHNFNQFHPTFNGKELRIKSLRRIILSTIKLRRTALATIKLFRTML